VSTGWSGRSPGFALIEPPAFARGPLLAGSPRLVALRILDRHWDSVIFSAPATLMLGLAVAMLPFRPAWPAAVVLAMLAMLHVCVLMCCLVGRGVLGVFRSGARGRDPDRFAARTLPDNHWHLPLCHQPADHRCEELLSWVTARVVELVAHRARVAAGEAGALADRVAVTENLVCLLRGATTWPMRTAIATAAGTSVQLDEHTQVAIITQPARWPAPEKRPFNSGSFIFWYVIGGAVVMLIEAAILAHQEREACAATDCSGRPATFGPAMRWLALQLVWSDSSGVSPATATWVLGVVFRLVGLTTIAVVAAAAYRFVQWQKHVQTSLLTGAGRPMPKVLIMVAKQVERDAVMAAVAAVNDTPLRLEFCGQHSVFFLGEVGGADIC
jgi:hypothetical protein